VHRALIVASFSIFALASSGRSASAQDRSGRDSVAEARAHRDTVAHATIDAGPVVDTSAHRLNYSRRERLLAGCVSRSMSSISYYLPLFCMQQANSLALAADDSAIIVRNGQEYRIAVRNAGGIPLMNRQKKAHALGGALIGGGLGFATAAFLSVRGTSSGFGSNALILGGTGAVIGAFSGSKYLTDWPRVLQETSTPSR
jgi:hypothetical protein